MSKNTNKDSGTLVSNDEVISAFQFNEMLTVEELYSRVKLDRHNILISIVDLSLLGKLEVVRTETQLFFCLQGELPEGGDQTKQI